jgi:DNA polymerase III delta prime subunit
MKDLIIHPQSRRFLEAYLKNPTHALLLSGVEGVGLGTIAENLARNLAGADRITIQPTQHDNQKTANINVKDIKGLRSLVRSKRSQPLAVVIDQAELMTDRAPEAFLKLLEEPTDNVHFILTSHAVQSLPKTILSRAQKIEVLPTPTELVQPLLANIKPEARRRQIEFIASGRPAEICRLSGDDAYFHNLSRQFERAKSYLKASAYERLKLVSEIKNRDEAVEFVKALAHLSELLAAKSNQAGRLAVLSSVLDNLVNNGHLKAQLTFLALNF